MQGGTRSMTDGVFVPTQSEEGIKLQPPRSLEEITDGLSNTVFVAEKRELASATPCNASTGWVSGFPLTVGDAVVGHDALFSGREGSPADDERNASVQCTSRAGGPHVVGGNVLMGDGSVRLMSFGMDDNLWRTPAISQRQGGLRSGVRTGALAVTSREMPRGRQHRGAWTCPGCGNHLPKLNRRSQTQDRGILLGVVALSWQQRLLALAMEGCRPEMKDDSRASSHGPGARPTRVRFEDVHTRAGIEFVHDNGASPAKLMPSASSGGAGWLDYDADGHGICFSPRGEVCVL